MKNEEFDRLMKEAMHEKMHEHRSTSVSKEETWKSIQKKLALSRKKRTKKYYILGAIALLFMVLSISILPYTSSAVPPYLQTIYDITEKAIALRIGTEDNNEPHLQTETNDRIELQASESLSTSFAEAQEQTDQALYFPTYVPERFELDDVEMEIDSMEGTVHHVTLRYVHDNDQRLYITQVLTGDEFSAGIVANNSGTTNILTRMVNQHEVKIITFDNESSFAYFNTSEQYVEISGPINKEEVIEIIRSLQVKEAG